MDDAERLLHSLLREGDLLLTLGAGDVDRLAGRLVARPPAEPVGGHGR
jgi:UDP-N-acetylmuramate-alanine ligase